MSRSGVYVWFCCVILRCVCSILYVHRHAPKVLSASSIKDHVCVPAKSIGIASRGISVGAAVVVKKRISAHFPHPKSKKKAEWYTDITEKNIGIVKSFNKEDTKNVVVTWSKTDGASLTWEVDFSIDLDKIALHGEGGSDAGSKPGTDGAPAVETADQPVVKSKKEFDFVEREDDVEFEVFKTWHTMQARDHATLKVKLLHGLLGFAQCNVISTMPTYTEGDFLLVKVGGDTRVYTLKDFDAHELAFAPETDEYKDRNWSQRRSALVQYDVGHCRRADPPAPIDTMRYVIANIYFADRLVLAREYHIE